MRLRTKEAGWLRNEACPKCRSEGKDKSGDNLGVFSDGHKYCWSCKTYYPATEKRKASELMEHNEVLKRICPTFKEEKVEGPHREWLQQYITDEEIDEFFFYDPFQDRHVFFHHKGEEDWFYSARSVSQYRIPKTICEGTRPALCLGAYKESRTLVVVEDIVSAIKVGRQFGAMPLFGSFLPNDWVIKACRTGFVDHLVVWLDEDKISDGRIYARKCNLYLPSIAIWTKKDPKAYEDSEIKTYVTDAVEMLKNEESISNRG